jgi:hypothetical protein
MKPRIVIAVLIVAALGISLIAFLRKPNNQSVSASLDSSGGTSAATESSGQKIQVTINGQPLSEFVAQNSNGEVKAPLSSKPLSSINASQISDVYAENNTWTVTFIDGSQTTVSPAMQASLPEEIRSRVVYKRGN